MELPCVHVDGRSVVVTGGACGQWNCRVSMSMEGRLWSRVVLVANGIAVCPCRWKVGCGHGWCLWPMELPCAHVDGRSVVVTGGACGQWNCRVPMSMEGRLWSRVVLVANGTAVCPCRWKVGCGHGWCLWPMELPCAH